MPAPTFFRHLLCSIFVTAAVAPSSPAYAQLPSVSSLTYADLGDMASHAAVVADVQVKQATRLRGDLALGVPPGVTRFLVEGSVTSLIKGAQGLPGQVSWLTDMPNPAPNRPARFPRKPRFLLLANPVEGRPGQLRLASPHAQIDWTPDMDRRVRAILTEFAAPDAPPRVTGVGNAFHVPGAIPGESETQIFLTTADGRPVSLSVLRRPGEQPRWAVALAEIVDDSAAPPQPDTLLWYRLACFLPHDMPAAATGDLDAEAAAATREDYALVIAGLGPCARSVSE